MAIVGTYVRFERSAHEAWVACEKLQERLLSAWSDACASRLAAEKTLVSLSFPVRFRRGLGFGRSDLEKFGGCGGGAARDIF